MEQERILLNPSQVLEILQGSKFHMGNLKNLNIRITGNDLYHIIELLEKDENPYYNNIVKNKLEQVLNENFNIKTRYT